MHVRRDTTVLAQAMVVRGRRQDQTMMCGNTRGFDNVSVCDDRSSRVIGASSFCFNIKVQEDQSEV